MKDRLDCIAAQRGLFESREKAKASIMAGVVLVDGQRVDKPGTKVDENAEITIVQAACPYVSRGGLKLEKAMECFGLDLAGAKAVDIGASTGGFTDCMLQNGASHVTCIDVGYGQLDWKLRNDPRVTNLEKTNVRYLDVESVGTDHDFILHFTETGASGGGEAAAGGGEDRMPGQTPVRGRKGAGRKEGDRPRSGGPPAGDLPGDRLWQRVRTGLGRPGLFSRDRN